MMSKLSTVAAWQGRAEQSREKQSKAKQAEYASNVEDEELDVYRQEQREEIRKQVTALDAKVEGY